MKFELLDKIRISISPIVQDADVFNVATVPGKVSRHVDQFYTASPVRSEHTRDTPSSSSETGRVALRRYVGHEYGSKSPSMTLVWLRVPQKILLPSKIANDAGTRRAPSTDARVSWRVHPLVDGESTFATIFAARNPARIAMRERKRARRFLRVARSPGVRTAIISDEMSLNEPESVPRRMRLRQKTPVAIEIGDVVERIARGEHD